MNGIRLRTKIEVMFVLFFLLMLAIVSVTSLTRTISDTSDSIETFIRNSKGNIWEPTGSNIQSALYSLNSTGGTVFLPVGTIYINAPILTVNNTKLVGAGYSTVLKISSSFSNSFGIIKAGVARKQNNITISDMTLDGNNTHAIMQFQTAKFITLQNLNIKNCLGNAIYFYGNSTNNLITNIRIYHTTSYQGIALDWVHDTIVSNIIISNSTGAGAFGIAANYGKNVTFDNIHIDNTSYGMKVIGISPYVSSNININNVFIDNVHTSDDIFKIFLANYVNINNLNINQSRGNGFVIGMCNYVNANNIYINGSTIYGIKVSDSKYVNINNGMTRKTTSSGVALDNCDSCTITNLQTMQAGVYNLISSSEDITIASSNFLSGASYGLDFADCSNFKVIGCNFLNNIGDGITTEVTSCNNFIIMGCYFKGNDKAMDIHASDNYFIISSCIADSGDSVDVNAALSSTRRVNDTICSLVVS